MSSTRSEFHAGRLQLATDTDLRPCLASNPATNERDHPTASWWLFSQEARPDIRTLQPEPLIPLIVPQKRIENTHEHQLNGASQQKDGFTFLLEWINVSVSIQTGVFSLTHPGHGWAVRGLMPPPIDCSYLAVKRQAPKSRYIPINQTSCMLLTTSQSPLFFNFTPSRVTTTSISHSVFDPPRPLPPPPHLPSQSAIAGPPRSCRPRTAR